MKATGRMTRTRPYLLQSEIELSDLLSEDVFFLECLFFGELQRFQVVTDDAQFLFEFNDLAVSLGLKEIRSVAFVMELGSVR